MELITSKQMEQLLKNGAEDAAAIAKDGNTPDHVPVVKLFNPTGSATWLITSVDPEDPDIAFGLCDLGMGSPELGSVSLSEIGAVKGKFGLGIERDIHFNPENKPLSQYADDARIAGHIKA